MMQGHFGAALLISALTKRAASLPTLFIAAQIQDLLIALFVYTLHIEETRLSTTNENKVYPIEILHVPYSHSLFTSTILSLAAFLLPTSLQGKYAISTAVFSHWLLDLLVHLPDLDICFPLRDCPKAGLGLWRFLIPSVAIESAIIIIGFALYLRSAPSALAGRQTARRLGPLVLFMVFVTVVMPFTPPPSRLDWTITVQTYVMYGLFAVLAWFGERPLIEGVADDERKAANGAKTD